MKGVDRAERVETVVVGGGQAGLAVGYHLAKADRPFVILDKYARVGDSWRRRWDSLRLFTPAGYSGLAGWPIPAPAWSFPTKDELADYLDAYATRFGLPVRTGVTVDRLSREDGRFVVVTTPDHRIEADNVVVASGHDHTPRIPQFARDLDARITQIHSSEYRRPSQLQAGGTLVVGAGNSGAEIALDVSGTHPTWLSGRLRSAPVGPSRNRFITAAMLPIISHVLTIDTPIGRKIGPRFAHISAPVERVRPKHLAAAGVVQLPRTVGVRNGLPVVEDGRLMDVANVIWCTGFRTDLGWIDLPIVGEDGEPNQERGVVRGYPGLFFVGRRFQYAFTSALLVGVSRDAAYVAKQIARRTIAPDPTQKRNVSRVSSSV